MLSSDRLLCSEVTNRAPSGSSTLKTCLYTHFELNNRIVAKPSLSCPILRIPRRILKRESLLLTREKRALITQRLINQRPTLFCHSLSLNMRFELFIRQRIQITVASMTITTHLHQKFAQILLLPVPTSI